MSTISSVKDQNSNDNKKMTRRFLLGILFSALSGVMLLLSFPPYGAWPLMWVGFVRISLPSTA